MATTTHTLTGTYVEIAADTTAVDQVQIQDNQSGYVIAVELVGSAAQPAVGAVGSMAKSGDTLFQEHIAKFATSGKLYARKMYGDGPAVVRVVV